MSGEYDMCDVSTTRTVSQVGTGWETTVLYDTSKGRMSARLPGALTNGDAIKEIVRRRKVIEQGREDGA
jgi:hypothetical protein